MTDSVRLARHLRHCFESGCEPQTGAVDAKLWFLALGRLVAQSALVEARFAAPRLLAAFPYASFARTAMLLERMPPAVDDPAFVAFVDRPERDVQVVPRRGALTVVFAFTGRLGGLGAPVPILHRWFGPTGAHVVYLRDPLEQAYTQGIPSLGADFAATAAAMKTIAAKLGAERTVCYGNSTGGYGALLYALPLRANSVLAVGALTDLSSALAARIGGRVVWRPGPDLSPIYKAASPRPRVRLVYGDGNEADAAAARRLAGIDGVVLEALPSYAGHDTHMALIERGRLSELLSELVGHEARDTSPVLNEVFG